MTNTQIIIWNELYAHNNLKSFTLRNSALSRLNYSTSSNRYYNDKEWHYNYTKRLIILNVRLLIGKIFLTSLQRCLVFDETLRIDYRYWIEGDNNSSNIPYALFSSRSNNLMTCWFWQNIIFNRFLLRKISAYPSEHSLSFSLSVSLSLSLSHSFSLFLSLFIYHT